MCLDGFGIVFMNLYDRQTAAGGFKGKHLSTDFETDFTD